MDTNFISVVPVDGDDINVVTITDIQEELQKNNISSYCARSIRKIKCIHIFNIFVIGFVASLLGVVVYEVAHIIIDQNEQLPYTLCWSSVLSDGNLNWIKIEPLQKNEWLRFQYAYDKINKNTRWIAGLEVNTKTKYYYDGAKPTSLQLCTYPHLNGSRYASEGTTLHQPKDGGQYECHLIYKQVQPHWDIYYTEYLCIVKGSCFDIPISVDGVSWDPAAVVRITLTTHDLHDSFLGQNETETNSNCKICGLC